MTEPTQCHDCGIDTAPCTGKRGCRHAGRWEWYAVHDDVWYEAQPWDGHGGEIRYLCVGCLERRLARTLGPDDFADVPINEPSPWDTPRLASRKAGRVEGVR